MKTKMWIALFGGICILCAAALLLFPAKKTDVAEIYQNGQLLYTISLSKVREPYDIQLERDGKSNTIHVIRGDLCITHASCPDGVCVNHGYLSSKAGPIVCLPNRVVIKYSGTPSDIDAVTGAAS